MSPNASRLGALNEECFVDVTFVTANGGGGHWSYKARKRHKNRGESGRHGLPPSVNAHAANHHEVGFVQACFEFYMIGAKPKNLIGDRACESNPPDETCEKTACSTSDHRCKPPTQDRRRLRR
jgi:hypothetical protein